MNFSVKANRLLTHEIGTDWQVAAKDFKEALKPLNEKERLSAVLFQLPESFHYTNDNRIYLAKLIAEFEGFPVMIEFRHKEWIRESVFEGLEKREAGIVFCDMPMCHLAQMSIISNYANGAKRRMPQLKNLPNGTVMKTPFIGSNAYIRLHGRNEGAWYAHAPKAQTSITSTHANGEVIQFGAVMLDENYNLLSEFSSYVKPVYSSVNNIINQLTNISNQNLEKADDFLTVFDKFCYWRGEGDITTFCWSKSDFNQLWSELEAKGKHRYDLFEVLHDFVDLQNIFGKLVSSKTSVGLEAAMRLLQMDFRGQVHTALSDSYNTARILHKLFCTESLDLDFEYINPSKKMQQRKRKKKQSTNALLQVFFLQSCLLSLGILIQKKKG